MQEVIILKAMQDFQAFSKYSRVLFKIPNFEKDAKSILLALQKYYQTYPDKKIVTHDELEAYYQYLNPQKKDMESINLLFKGMRAAEIANTELLRDLLNQTVEQYLSVDIADIATAVMQESRGTGIEDIRGLVRKYDEVTGLIDEIENDVCNLPIRDLFAKVTGEGLKFRLKWLRETYGFLRPGTLGHIFARPDAGKTSLALNELVHFAYQLDDERPALYLNNEEGIERIKARAMSAMLSVTPQWIMENFDEAEDKWERGKGDRLKFIGGINHISKVVQKLERFNPRVIVIDQGPKVDTYGSMEGVQRLQILYNQYRDLANEHDCSIITLGQADNNAENRRYLNLNNLDASKVAIQGELDWCLGIGRVDTEGFEEVRYLSNVKNKLTGRYGRGEVHFDIQCCRFTD
jgi:hypothetical protein